MRCEHCGKPAWEGRRLCRLHYMNREVRLMYYTKFAGGGEPTMEELEQLIAYQSRPENLPSWWESEFERIRQKEQQERDRANAPHGRHLIIQKRKRSRPSEL